MRKILIPLFVIGTVLLAGCGSTSTAASSCSTTFKVGFVTDIGKLGDKGFNDAGWKGVQDAVANKSLCVQAKFLESNQPTDYQPNMQQFIDQGYQMVVAAGFLLTDDTAKVAAKNLSVKFANVDAHYDKPTANLLGIAFKEDQSGFLAGALAGYMTKTNHIGGVYGLNVPAVIKFRKGYEAGAKYTNPNIKVDGVYHPPSSSVSPFGDPDWGKARGQDMISSGADILFGAGGSTGNGALLAAAEAHKLCVGVDVDQYFTYQDARSCLITSAEKSVSAAVTLAIKDGVNSQWPSNGEIAGTVGLAPYHNFDSQISADIKSKMTDLTAKIANGTVTTGVTVP